jgi:CubicO group peptidase (beta-lactamase class C family)
MRHRFTLFLLCPILVLAQQKPAAKTASQTAHIQRIEQNVASIALGKGEKPTQFTLPELMKVLDVPGLSVAVFDNYKILWAKGYGVTESGSSNPVTTQTLFQAGDISQGVVAVGALALVGRGKLSLDENVNDELHSWKLPDNEFTKSEKVTLRRILSHTAGLAALDLPGYAPADPVMHTEAEPVPTILQILDGEKPANTAPVRVETVPGAKFLYSNGGAIVEQLVLTDATGKPFPKVMYDLVLRKARMNESTFEEPLPPPRMAVAAVGTQLDGTSVIGQHLIYPEMAALGLWTTASDLARFAIEIANSANGHSTKVISQKMAQLMLKPQFDGRTRCIGFFLNDSNNLDAFSADAATKGFQAIFMASSNTGRGFVIMANSDHGIDVGSYLVPAILREYGWKFPTPTVQAETILRVIASAGNVDGALDWFRDLKNSGSTETGYGSYTLNRFGFLFLRNKDVPTAIKIFKLNTELFPSAFHAYELLGEAYTNAGQKDLAIMNYERSLELNPKNDNAAEMLKRLQRQ